MSRAGPEPHAEKHGGTLVAWSSTNVCAGLLAADAGLHSAAAPPEQMAPAAVRDERRQPAASSAPPARQQPPPPEEEEGANDYDSDEASKDTSTFSTVHSSLSGHKCNATWVLFQPLWAL